MVFRGPVRLGGRHNCWIPGTHRARSIQATLAAPIWPMAPLWRYTATIRTAPNSIPLTAPTGVLRASSTQLAPVLLITQRQ